MLVIDLTLIEDECTSTTLKPLDINGNEILVATNTKPDSKVEEQHSPLSMKKSASNAFQSMMDAEKMTPEEKSTNSPILFTNLTQNGCRMPPKEQLKFINKYNHWMRYFRVYNGFRLFAQQNHAKAQLLSNKIDDKVFIQSILVKWWNALPPAAKEQYAQMTETIHRQKLYASSNTNTNHAINMITSSILPNADTFDTNTNKANDVN